MPSVQATLATVIAAVSITTAIMQFAYWIGKLRSDIDRAREQTADHAATIRDYGSRIEKTEDHVRDILNDRRRVS